MPEFVHTHKQFLEILKGNTLVVVDFTATWCGPCQRIAPQFAELDAQYKSIKFIKIDVDVNNETATTMGIHAMPTFLLFINGTQVDDLVGADLVALEPKIKKLLLFYATDEEEKTMHQTTRSNEIVGGEEKTGIGIIEIE